MGTQFLNRVFVYVAVGIQPVSFSSRAMILAVLSGVTATWGLALFNVGLALFVLLPQPRRSCCDLSFFSGFFFFLNAAMRAIVRFLSRTCVDPCLFAPVSSPLWAYAI